MEGAWPKISHNSSAMWGARGERARATISNGVRCRPGRALNSLTAIINAETLVLNDRVSMSDATLCTRRWAIFNASTGAGSSDRGAAVNNRHVLRRKLLTPAMPWVSQGLDCSKGPKNISYNRSPSAPTWSATWSGLTTLCLDLDIFSTSRSTRTTPSSVSKVASANSGSQARNPAWFSSFFSFTRATST